MPIDQKFPQQFRRHPFAHESKHERRVGSIQFVTRKRQSERCRMNPNLVPSSRTRMNPGQSISRAPVAIGTNSVSAVSPPSSTTVWRE